MQFSFASLHLLLLVLAASGVHAIPTPRVTREVSIERRQDVSKPMTVKTTNTKDTPAGTVTEICEIKLTPIKDDQGNDAVQVVKSCTLQMDASGESNGNGGGNSNPSGGGNTNGGGDNNNNNSSSSSSSSASSTDSANSSSATGSSSSSAAGSNTASSSASSTGSGSASSTGSADAANTSANVSVTDSIPASADTVKATGSSSTSAASGTGSSNSAASTGTSAAASNGSSSSAASSSGTSDPAASATAANDSTASPTTSPTQNFTIPGKNISVLPIGLGVFAGISVIALIVVGLVTYERTKYRKAFRQRKMAESGAAMGYGGMAQRA